MTKTLTQALAFTLAAAATFSTFAEANGLANQQLRKTEAAVASDLRVDSVQTVVVVGHRSKRAA